MKRTVNFPCSYTQFASLFGTIVRSAETASGIMVSFGWADLSQVIFMNDGDYAELGFYWMGIGY